MALLRNSFFPGLILLLFGLSPLYSRAQDRPGFVMRYLEGIFNDTTSQEKSELFIYPTLGYAPETSWEIGFSTLYVFYTREDIRNRLSEISAFTFFTLENQYGLWLDHALYTDQNRWFFLGRWRYQSFPLQYYGIGPQAPVDYLARIDGNFLLIRQRVLRELAPSLYFGLEVDYQNLSRSQLVPATGTEVDRSGVLGLDGSSNLGFGSGLVYDTRHNVLNVRKGQFHELAWLSYQSVWGSDFTFNSLISDNRFFRPVGQNNVLAAQVFGQFTLGEAPFNQLALMGGENLMRGYYLGRYRDDHQLAAQVEFRMLPLPFARRFGATAFLAAGQVFSDEQPWQWQQNLVTGGIGGRFLMFPKKDIWMRVDWALTRDSQGVYFFIGEAF